MQITVSDEGVANNRPNIEERQDDEDAAEYDEEDVDEESEEEGAVAEQDFEYIDRHAIRPLRSNTTDPRMTSRALARNAEKIIKDETKKPQAI